MKKIIIKKCYRCHFHEINSIGEEICKYWDIPKIYNYCMKNIGFKKVIEYVNENAPNNKCKIPIKHRQLNLFSNIKTG